MTETHDHPNVRMHPPLVLIIFLGLEAVLMLIIPIRLSLGAMGSLLGLVSLGVAIYLFFGTARAMSKAETTTSPHGSTTTIVTEGPFSFTRNPFYLTMIFAQLSLGFFLESAWFLIMIGPFMGVMYWAVIAREEAYLERKFGDIYLNYKSRVRRWLSGIRYL